MKFVDRLTNDGHNTKDRNLRVNGDQILNGCILPTRPCQPGIPHLKL